MQDMGDSYPVTLQSVHRLLSLQEDDFVNYVVCPKCDSVYKDGFEVGRNGLKESKYCDHVCFPKHPHASQRTPCGAMLVKVKCG